MLLIFHTHKEIKLKLLAVFLAALTPFLIFIFYLFDLWFDTQRQLIIEENIKTTRILSVSIGDAFKTTQAMAAILSDTNVNQAYQSADILDDDKRLKDLLSLTQEKVPGLEALTLFDRQGKIITTSLELADDKKEESIADRPYFRKAVETGKAADSGIIIGRYSGHRIVNFISPFVVNNQVQNVASATYNIERLKGLLETTIGDTDKPIILLDPQGNVAFRLFQPLNGTDGFESLASNQYVQDALQGHESIFEFKSFPRMKDGTYIGTATPIGSSSPHWVVISLQSTKEIFAPITSLQNNTWIILGSALVFSVLLVSLVLRKIRIIY